VPVSVDYVARETASNLWRNRLMTIAAVLTVAVSLTLVGAALLLRQGAANATGQWERGTQVTVWMQPNANKQEIHAVGDPAGAVELRAPALRLLEQGAQLRRGQASSCRPMSPGHHESEMPTSFWCTPVALSDANQVIQTFKGTPGVDTVTAPCSRSTPRRR
jgi:cell division transport system permease protein